jgi:hypothetical protein
MQLPAAASPHTPVVAVVLQAVFADSDQVVLNVGGCRFTTTVSTLRSAPSPSLFSAMFSGRHAVVRGTDGAVFIDRCGNQ